ncbi:MAG: 50S ribosomal protein L10 [Leptospirales bacterium]
MPAPSKIKQLTEIKSMLDERADFVVTTYSGLSVDEISDLRGQVRARGARFRVVKNNLFQIALKENATYAELNAQMAEVLKGPVAITFISEDYPVVSKLLMDYAKKQDKVQIKSGVMDGEFLKKQEVEAIASLPSREELLAIIGRGLNTPATKIATGINQILAGLARGIKAVGEKNG